MKNIGNLIKEKRLLLLLTQEELAYQAKINVRTLQRIENNASKPRGKTLQLICEILDIEVSSLSIAQNNYHKKVINKVITTLFLFVLNLTLIAITGYLTLDINANANSRFGGLLLSIAIPYIVVGFTQNLNGAVRLLKFGLGYFAYFIFILASNGLKVGLLTFLFPCLFLSIATLYFGNYLMIKK